MSDDEVRMSGILRVGESERVERELESDSGSVAEVGCWMQGWTRWSEVPLREGRQSLRSGFCFFLPLPCLGEGWLDCCYWYGRRVLELPDSQAKRAGCWDESCNDESLPAPVLTRFGKRLAKNLRWNGSLLD